MVYGIALYKCLKPLYIFLHDNINTKLQSEKEPVLCVGPPYTHINIHICLLNIVGEYYKRHHNFLSVPFSHQS